MSEFAAGKEVLSYCGKCKLPLAHMIVVMKDPKTIGKVTCKTCGATHAYKDPATKAKKVKTTKSKAASKKSVNINDLWAQEIASASGTSQKYTIKTKFAVGDLIDHKKFGPGVVQALVDGKIEVLFQHEVKILVHNL
ncbi:MAG: hypothetical protein N4A33_10985 [Bacteriovoracaceae bacterium]|jgi:DNA-directed RNA polymerase subunit M/transcription elongation factor TFIIS|nr:hypothetical protein [Bacteriovoracaceae bacterium]